MHQKVVPGEVPENGWILNGFWMDFGMDFDSLLVPFSIKNMIENRYSNQHQKNMKFHEKSMQKGHRN